jgi:hypothetical protein
VFGLLQQGFETSFEKYNNGYLPEINNENNDIITVDVNIENNENENTNEEAEISIENNENSNTEVFSQSEQNDIEQILNILE